MNICTEVEGRGYLVQFLFLNAASEQLWGISFDKAKIITVKCDV